MFTGIVESTGTVEKIETQGRNIHFTMSCVFAHELTIDQSVAHNGCCLTVVELLEGGCVVTAIDETLKKTNLGSWTVGAGVNLERCMLMNGRLDGHIVQGHVDVTGIRIVMVQIVGRYVLSFEYGAGSDCITVL